MSPRKQAVRERAAKVAELRAAQQRAERRRSTLILGGAVALSVLLLGGVAFSIQVERNQQTDLEAAADAPIEGVQEFPDLPRDHVNEPVDYAQSPPVGGNHAGVWTNCGTYEDPVSNEQSVHSLEHGAVWITYQPDLPSDQVDALRQLVQGKDYALLSPFDGLAAPVMASAWGVQVTVEDASDPRLQQFLTKYLQGEQTPEPGAACTGGVGAG